MAKEREQSGFPRALVLCCGAFALGAVCGFCLTAWLRSRGAFFNADWLSGYGLGFSAGVRVSFWETLWDAVRWPAFVWLLGFTVLGAWMIPVTFALRGFFLCFCVAGLSAAGPGGLLLAFLLFGLSALVTLPVFFLLGVRSWTQAAGQRGRLWIAPGEIRPGYWLQSALAFGCTVCCAGAEYWLLPILLKTASPLLGGR